MSNLSLGDVLARASIEKCGRGNYPVLSMTMHDGLVFQGDRFKKRIASKDQSAYNVVHRNQLVVGFPIDEGVLAVQDIADAGIVSPAYRIWDINQNAVVPEYLEMFLRSSHSIQFYKSKLKGSTARRRSITDADFLKMELPTSDLMEQEHVVDVIGKVARAIRLRKRELESIDELVKSQFVEMFGDPENPSSDCEVCKLGDRCDVVTGNTPARARKEFYGPGIEWIKSDNVLPGAMRLKKAKEQLTDAGKAVARIAKPGWLLMVCIAGSPNTIGNTAFVDREVAFNQQINGIDPRDENPIYLQAALGLLKPRLTSGLNAALKCILNKSTLSATEVPFPSRGLQDDFAAFVAQVDKSGFAVRRSIEQLELLKAKLMQEYFS